MDKKAEAVLTCDQVKQDLTKESKTETAATRST